MKRSGKVLVIFITILVVVFLTFDFGLFKGLVSGIIISQVEKNTGLTITFKSAQLGWFNFSAEELFVAPKGLPFGFTFEKASGECPTSAIFGNPKGCKVNFSLYKGSGELLFPEENLLTGKISNVELSGHPFFAAHGIDSGLFSVPQFEQRFSSDSSHLLVTLILADIIKSKPSTLSPGITKLPLPIRLEPIQIKSANVAIEAALMSGNRLNKLSIKNLAAESDLGNISDRSYIEWAAPQFQTARLYFTPSAIGLTAIKPFAQFLCPPETLETAQPLLFRLDGQQPSCQIATD